MNRNPIRFLLNAGARLCVVLIVIASLPGTAFAGPSPGTDPCSRAMAQMATPAAPSTPSPTSNRLAVSQTIMSFASCFNRHNWDGVLALTGEGFREAFIGASTPDDVRRRLTLLDNRGLLPELRIQSIEENGTTGSVLATLVVTWRGWSGLHSGLWRLQLLDGFWRLTGRSIERPSISGVAAGMEVIIQDAGLTTPRSDLVDPGTVILAFSNKTAADSTALVLEVTAASTPQSIAADCLASANTPLAPAGAIQVAAGETAYLPLLELPAGRYGIVVGIDPCLGNEPVTAAQVATIDISS